MKILNVNASLDPTEGGTNERTFQMSRALLQAGVDVTILVTDRGLTESRKESLREARLIPLPSMNARFYVPRTSPWRVCKIVRDADIVHLMGHWTVLNALVYWAARRLNTPYVVCPAGALSIFGRSRILKRLYNGFIGKKIIRNAERLIAITDHEKVDFVSYGADPARFVTIPNAIWPQEFTESDDTGFRERYRLGENPFVLFVGRLNPIKGPDLLLNAFARVQEALPRLDLVFAGPDEGMLGILESSAKSLELANRVYFIGRLAGREKSCAYHAASFLAVPSRQEAMSIVALEAGITSTPVLLTDRCGFDQIESVGGGIIVPASVEGLADGLLRMAKSSGELRLMGERLRTLVVENFTWDSVVSQYLISFKQVLAGRL